MVKKVEKPFFFNTLDIRNSRNIFHTIYIDWSFVIHLLEYSIPLFYCYETLDLRFHTKSSTIVQGFDEKGMQWFSGRKESFHRITRFVFQYRFAVSRIFGRTNWIIHTTDRFPRPEAVIWSAAQKNQSLIRPRRARAAFRRRLCITNWCIEFPTNFQLPQLILSMIAQHRTPVLRDFQSCQPVSNYARPTSQTLQQPIFRKVSTSNCSFALKR